MIPALLLAVGGTLPPPPTPSPNEPLGVWQIFAIATLVLGAVTLISFSWRNRRPRHRFGEKGSRQEGVDPAAEPSPNVEDARTILRFPQRDDVAPPRPAPTVQNRATWAQHPPPPNPIVGERLRRITSPSGAERRRLGDCQPKPEGPDFPGDRQGAPLPSIRPLAIVRPPRAAQPSVGPAEADAAPRRLAPRPADVPAAPDPVPAAHPTTAARVVDVERGTAPGDGLEVGPVEPSRPPKRDEPSADRLLTAEPAEATAPENVDLSPSKQARSDETPGDGEAPMPSSADGESGEPDRRFATDRGEGAGWTDPQALAAPRPEAPDLKASGTVAAKSDDRVGGGSPTPAMQDDPGTADVAVEIAASPAESVDGIGGERSQLSNGDAEIVDSEIWEGVERTVRELLFCANVGELLHGFALYTDPLLFRTMDETGLDEEEFHRVFSAIPARGVETWTRVGGFKDLRVEADGAVTAEVRYRPSAVGAATPPERYRFVLDRARGIWMIDDISPIGATAIA